jgi:hypothetical protein
MYRLVAAIHSSRDKRVLQGLYGENHEHAASHAAFKGCSMIDEKTISVPQAGRRYYGLGKNASYDAAKRGEIPTIKIGARLRVPVIAMERILQSVAIPEPANIKSA